ncbi:MAG: putative nucleotidyltransferase substrate binding domain-containing protein [archaeon]
MNDSSSLADRITQYIVVMASSATFLALSEGIEETNTVRKIEALYRKNVITEAEKEVILNSHDYLFRLSLELRLEATLGENKKERSGVLLDRMLVRESIQAIRNFRNKIERYLVDKYQVTREGVLSYGTG